MDEFGVRLPMGPPEKTFGLRKSADEKSFLFYTMPMNERPKNREAQPYVNVTEMFLQASESEFKEEMAKLKDIPVSIEIEVSQLGSDSWQGRLRRFQQGFGSNAIRKAIVRATQGEKDIFESRFPGVEWKIMK